MNQDILDQNNLADEENEKIPAVNKEDKQTESSISEDKAPPHTYLRRCTYIHGYICTYVFKYYTYVHTYLWTYVCTYVLLCTFLSRVKLFIT